MVDNLPSVPLDVSDPVELRRFLLELIEVLAQSLDSNTFAEIQELNRQVTELQTKVDNYFK